MWFVIIYLFLWLFDSANGYYFSSAARKLQVVENSWINLIRDEGCVVMLYYLPWHSSSMGVIPEYRKASVKGNLWGTEIVYGSLNCQEYSGICQYAGIIGYPTLEIYIRKPDAMLVEDGKISLTTDTHYIIGYDGKMIANSISDWVLRVSAVNAKINNVEQYKLMSTGGNPSVLLGVWRDSTSREAFETVGKEYHGRLLFANVDNEDLIESIGILSQMTDELKRNKQSFIVAIDSEENEIMHVISYGIDELTHVQEFARENEFPLCSEFTQEAVERLMTGNRFASILVLGGKLYDLMHKEGTDMPGGYKLNTNSLELIEGYKSLARGNRHDFAFFTISPSNNLYKRFLDHFGVTDDMLPLVRVLKYIQESQNEYPSVLKYRPSDEKSEFILRQTQAMLDNIRLGKLQPYYKSEPIPEFSAKDGSVHYVVGSTFKEHVVDNDLDVFITLHAPWCGHCRAMDKTWNLLAKKFKTVPGIKIAKMDATQNEVPGVVTSGYPTILFYPANNKQFPMKYSGIDRSLESFIHWIHANATKAKFDPKKLIESTTPEPSQIEKIDEL